MFIYIYIYVDIRGVDKEVADLRKFENLYDVWLEECLYDI